MATSWFANATLVGGSPTRPVRSTAVSARALADVSSLHRRPAAEMAAAGAPSPVEQVPGQGYDSFTGRACGYPMEPAPLTTVPASARGQQVVYEIRSVTSASELRQEIGVSAEGSFTGFGVDVGAKARWSRAQATSEFSAYLLVKITVRNSRLRLGAFRLNADALALVGAPDFLKQFYRRYGDCFISDYVTGGEFLGLYEFQSRTSREREDVSAKVSAVGGMWSASGEFAANMQKLNVDTTVRMSVYVDGGEGALPEFEPAAVLEFARTFPDAVNPANGSPVLYDTETTSYYKAAGFPASIDLPFTENHERLEDLAREMDRVRACRSSLAYILENRGGFADAALDVRQVRATLEKVERAINKGAVTLAEHAWEPGASVDLDGIRGVLDGVVAQLPEAKPAEAAPAPASTRVTRPGKGFYVIGAVNSGKVFDVSGVQASRGARIQMWGRCDAENQLWRFQRLDDGSYVIRSVLNNLVLDVSGKSGHDGAALITWDWNEGSNQKWRLEAQPDHSVIIRSVMNDKVLDVTRYSTDDGAQLQLWTQHGKDNQRFVIEEVLGVKLTFDS